MIMRKDTAIRPPFIEIGPKNYLYGSRILDLALAADLASEKYDVDVIFTTPYADIRVVAEKTKNIHVFAPHMDAEPVGRGLANVLPESLKAAGAQGVMLNHSEKPLALPLLERTITRAKEVGLYTIVCADSISEIKEIAALEPDIIVAEPVELIASAKGADLSYLATANDAVKSVDPNILVLVGAGIRNGRDVYEVISRGCDASGSSSGIALADDPEKMIDEMVAAAREAWDARNAV